ncbi:lytic transglycosylase domain-containing protein [Microbacterium sp. SLBN-111]|uniref:lytic transglycosylase domain-containing protein n=1 Tax=Microbacterium sp. SLBN-111 TaxID=3377733 RepID=UPI003C7568A4
MDLDAGRGRSWSSVFAAVLAALFVGIAAVLVVSAQAAGRERPLEERIAAPATAEIAATVTTDATSTAEVSEVPAPDPAPAGAPPAAAPPAAQLFTADATWSARIAAATGIPERALRAYASAALTLKAEQPSCGLGWNTLAGIGAIESAHGTHSGGHLDEAGYPQPAIRGIPLDGSASAAIADTDGGRWDGDAAWDRAVGPLQFIPATWQRWGADGNGDGVADPNQIDDAALAAGRYLCAAGEMTSASGWRRAIFSYNHLDSYVDDVAAMANTYAARAAG